LSFFHCSAVPRHLHPFPTRRSSDLGASQHLLTRALVEAPPLLLRDGGVIADGYDAELDELRRLDSDAASFLSELEARERTTTGRSEEHTSELQSRENLVCRLLLEKK